MVRWWRGAKLHPGNSVQVVDECGSCVCLNTSSSTEVINWFPNMVTRKLGRTINPKPHKNQSGALIRPSPTLNLRSLRSNFQEVELHLLDAKLHLLFNPSIWVQELAIRAYSPLTYHRNRYGDGFGVYINDGSTRSRDPTKKDPDYLYMCFRVAISFSFFIVHRMTKW